MTTRKTGDIARKFYDSLSTLDFNPALFTILLHDAPIVIRRRILEVLIALIESWSWRFDNALWKNQEEFEFLVDAKRLQDAILVMREHYN